MRIKMLKDVATVGEYLEKGKVYEIQDLLAKALIERGQAEDAFKVPVPRAPKLEPVKPVIIEAVSVEEKPEVKLEEVKVEEAKPVAEKVAEKPAKKAAKKPAKKA